ncbi:hypothetical protein Acr_18g0012130 [Actinidia rufa]|uniref:Integrase catalytic domain-containing protein n=1 Tax=Actinidia rufa TaxID=165716 RepID=A0A7J0G8D4_9ERIC|nr:hypothetical protein Acr_18g0012130 [Actinidia rufa]
MSLEQGCLVSAHKEEESSDVGSSEIQPIPCDLEAIQELPQVIETTAVGEMTEGLEVILELPQINPTVAWKMFVNGSRNSLGEGAGVVLKSLEGAIFEQCLRLNFLATNNEAEYEAFNSGLQSSKKLKAKGNTGLDLPIRGLAQDIIPGFLLAVHSLSLIEDVLFEIHEAYVRKCTKCQLFSPFDSSAIKGPNPLTSPLALCLMGNGHHGGLALSFEEKRFLLAATDNFIKWVEVEPLTQIREMDVIKFIRRNILSRFGIPRAFISDNGTKFIGKKIKDLLEQLKIEFYNSTLSYPQCNGQAEATNKTILNGIKKRLEKAKGKWVKELPNILWAYRTTPQKATNETPYSLAFGFEAVISLKVSLPIIQIEAYCISHNEEVLACDLDLVDERRENVLIWMADYQKQLAKTYN